MECETRWTVDGHELTILDLANLLKELIIMQQKRSGLFHRNQKCCFDNRKTEKIWNKEKEGAWRKFLGKVDYGIKSS